MPSSSGRGTGGDASAETTGPGAEPVPPRHSHSLTNGSAPPHRSHNLGRYTDLMRKAGVFRQAVLRWFRVHRRELPWRRQRDRSDPYRILVSEVMLQQTQVPRVTVIYERFLKRFPTLESLAQASNRDVLIAWRGMGYNNRALRLRDAARFILERTEVRISTCPSTCPPKPWRRGKSAGRSGKFEAPSFPKEMEELQKIPGVGPYTAAAIRNFAFNLPTPCLDTNIRRVLHRAFFGWENPDGSWKVSDKALLKLAEELLEIAVSNEPINQSTNKRRRFAADWHSALMDYGSLICTKKNPRWDICPLTKAGLMKAARSALRPPSPNPNPNPKREPGRFELGRFVPNRIYRGRIVDLLRTHHRGLPPATIGARVKRDWRTSDRRWLHMILQALIDEGLLTKRRRSYALAS